MITFLVGFCTGAVVTSLVWAGYLLALIQRNMDLEDKIDQMVEIDERGKEMWGRYLN